MKYLWLFDIDSAMVIPLVSAVLFMLGGGGVKWLRRFALPTFLFASLVSMGENVWLSASSCAILSISMIKGYGESLREEVGDAGYYILMYAFGHIYGLALMPMADSLIDLLLPLIPCVIFGSLTLISQKNNWFTWKLVEGATGFAIGFIAYTLLEVPLGGL